MVPNIESVNPNYGFATCRRRWPCIIVKIKEGTSHRGRGRQASEPEKAHFTGKFILVANFGVHVLHRFASNLLNVIRQIDIGRWKFQFRWIQYLVFDNYLVGLNVIFDCGSAKAIILWVCFSSCNRVLFIGGSFRDVPHFMGDPY